MAKVLVALSGGVDSAVSAFLLKQAGHQLTAVTLRLYEENQMLEKVKSLANHLGIELRVLDWQNLFRQEVISEFKQEYFVGRTPNPCVICNKKIKFGKLLDYALTNGFDFLATGHYVQKIWKNGEPYLKRARTFRRDQSYYLYHLSHQQLKHIMFPLGHVEDKSEVINLYKTNFEAIADSEESRGICFTSGEAYGDWLAKDSLAVGEGDVYDNFGQYRGRHQGFYRYTIGQKRLPNIPMLNSECVLELKAEKNQLVIGDETLVFSLSILLDEVYYDQALSIGDVLTVKIFNWGYDLEAKIKELGKNISLEFAQPVRAVALGQYAVAYQEDVLVLGGRIIGKS